MLLIYDEPSARREMQPADWTALAAADLRYRREQIPGKGGELLDGYVLELPQDAFTVNFRKGVTSGQSGPALDTPAWLAGFYLIECESAEVAADIARIAPMPDGCGRVEIRPVMERPPIGVGG